MSKVSASQAAKLTGKSVPTITRACKSGKISHEKKDGGGYLIDVAELTRVFPAVSNESNVTSTKLGNETPQNIKVLEREIELLREMLGKAETDRDGWKEQAQKVTGLIENQQESRTPSGGFQWVPRFLRRDVA